MATRRTFIPRPEHVFVSHATYRIQWMTEDEWAAANEPDTAAGVTRSSRHFIGIRLQPGSAENYLRENLLHEIMHAVYYMAHIETGMNHIDDENREEFIVDSMAGTMLFVLKHNPEVLAYLTDDQEH